MQSPKIGDVVVFTRNDCRFGELGIVCGFIFQDACKIEMRCDCNNGTSFITICYAKIRSFEVIDHDIDKYDALELVSNLIAKGFLESEIERALDLPRATLRKDKSKELITLLKLVNRFPWMIRVAEKNYDILEAKKAMCHAAIDEMFPCDCVKSKK